MSRLILLVAACLLLGATLTIASTMEMEMDIELELTQTPPSSQEAILAAQAQANTKVMTGTCTAIQTTSANVIVSGAPRTSYDLGDSVTVSCADGYSLLRSSRLSALPTDLSARAGVKTLQNFTLICSGGGYGSTPTWSTPPATLNCIPTACPTLVLTDGNLTVTDVNGVHGDVRRFSCAKGYTLDGKARTKCQAGSWVPSTVPTCFISECDAFKAPINGRAFITSNATSPYKTLKYSCNPGYKLNGAPEAYCLQNRNWSTAAPTCDSFGLKPYNNRRFSFSSGSVSIDNKYVMDGILETARSTANCIGFTISRVNGLVSAVLLHSDESFLQRKPGSDTYLFGTNGKYELHKDFAAISDRAALGSIDFHRDGNVVRGVMIALKKLQAADPEIIGFTINKGTNFQTSVATWSSLPLEYDEDSQSFTLSSLERTITEKGCYGSDKYNRGALTKKQLLSNLRHGSQASRLYCAQAARIHGHKYFALSNGECYSGSQDPARFGEAVRIVDNTTVTRGLCGGSFSVDGTSTKPGAVQGAYHTFEIDSSELSMGTGATRCDTHYESKLNYAAAGERLGNATIVRSSLTCQNKCSNNIRCGLASYNRKSNKCSLFASRSFSSASTTASAKHITFHCNRPVLVNGGFERSSIGGPFTPRAGRTHITVNASLPITVPRGWTVSGNVGLAILGSNFTNLDRSIPEGRVILYMKNSGVISQKLHGLTVGKKYQVSFLESFRVSNSSYQSGATLLVYAGKKMIYSNLDVNIPLWEKRVVEFTATKPSLTLRFITNIDALTRRIKAGLDENISIGDISTVKTAVLLDSISVYPAQLRVNRGRASSTKRGTIAKIPVTHPRILAALQTISAKKPNTIGFTIKNSKVRLISKNHIRPAGLLPDSSATIYLNNGTTLPGFTTAASNGYFHFAHSKGIHKALTKLSKLKSNTVGYSLGAGRKFQATILGAGALPFENNAEMDMFLFEDVPYNLGCWSAEYQTDGKDVPLVLETRQIIVGGVSKHACSLAAARSGHRFFALQNKVCVSGNKDDFKANGASSQCSLRCSNGADLCGGEKSAIVYRLPTYTRLSRSGVVTLKPELVSQQDKDLSHLIFEQPGTYDFTTRNVAQPTEKQLAKVAALPPRPDGTQPTFRHSLVYHFPGSQRQVVALYTITSPKSADLLPLAPRSWVVEGSVAGHEWTTLDESENVLFTSVSQRRTFQLRNTKQYHFIRFLFTDNQAQNLTGVAMSGMTINGDTDTLIELSALYRFESPANPGFDSSTRFNDLKIYGQTNRVRVSTNEEQAHMGNGFLEFYPDESPASVPTYLSVDPLFTGIAGLPGGTMPFSVAFWMFVNKSDLVPDSQQPLGLLAWGDLTSADASEDGDFIGGEGHSLQFSPAADSLSSSFSTPGLGLRTASTPLTDAWHHYTVTFDYDTGYHAIYVDGVEAVSRLYEATQFRMVAADFKIGLTSLSENKDQFVGSLDDIAVFKGALTDKQVTSVMYGDFTPWLPLACQQISDRFGVASGETWGTANERVKKEYLRNECMTTPSSCQTYSDVFGISPDTKGVADLYVSDAYEGMKCNSWPSFNIREGVSADCHGKQVVKLNILDIEAARRRCLKQRYPRCAAYVWSPTPRKHLLPSGQEITLPPNSLAMCDAKLHGYFSAPGSEVAHRLRSYFIIKDTSNRCDEEQGKIVADITSNMDARTLCDKQTNPPCVGYIWTGPIGIGHNASAPATPNTIMMCAGYREHHATELPNSKYETASVVGEYMVYPRRYGRCSVFSEIATKFDVMNSLEARLHCDHYDGTRGPKCLSYVWDIKKGEVRLCAGVPQGSLELFENVETAWARPNSCQEISNRWGVAFNVTWGNAPVSVKNMYVELSCRTAPSSCQELSNFYGLSPKLDSSVAERTPGSIRDLWLNQKCATSPVGVALDRYKPAYQQILNEIATVDAGIAQVDDILTRASYSRSKDHQTDMEKEVIKARTNLQETLNKLP